MAWSSNSVACRSGMISIVSALCLSASQAWSADYIEYACIWSQHCEVPGQCTAAEPVANPGFFVTERKVDKDRVFFDRITANFYIDGGVKDDEDLIYDVGYYSEQYKIQAWFGGKSGRTEMMTIAEDGRAQKTTHYPSLNKILISLGSCERIEN